MCRVMMVAGHGIYSVKRAMLREQDDSQRAVLARASLQRFMATFAL